MRGLDVGAKAEIFALIRELAHSGIGILLIADTLEELIALSDTIVVMRDGKITGRFAGVRSTGDPAANSRADGLAWKCRLHAAALRRGFVHAADPRHRRDLRTSAMASRFAPLFVLIALLAGLGFVRPSFLSSYSLTVLAGESERHPSSRRRSNPGDPARRHRSLDGRHRVARVGSDRAYAAFSGRRRESECFTPRLEWRRRSDYFDLDRSTRGKYRERYAGDHPERLDDSSPPLQ